MIVESRNSYKASAAILVQVRLNEHIRILEVKKATVIPKAKFCSLKRKVQAYFVANDFMPETTSLKDILAIEQRKMCPNLPKYGSKSMQHFKETCSRIHLKCATFHLLHPIGAMHIHKATLNWKPSKAVGIHKKNIKASSNPAFNYLAFIKKMPSITKKSDRLRRCNKKTTKLLIN